MSRGPERLALRASYVLPDRLLRGARHLPAEREALDLTTGVVVHDLWRATRDETGAP
jgi:hypothetical protein